MELLSYPFLPKDGKIRPPTQDETTSQQLASPAGNPEGDGSGPIQPDGEDAIARAMAESEALERERQSHIEKIR